jgi:hypothetical protein
LDTEVDIDETKKLLKDIACIMLAVFQPFSAKI